MTRRMLSVDWDFFFKEEPQWEWHHGTHPASVEDVLWLTRASEFIRTQGDVPQAEGNPALFWDRVSLAKGAVLYIAESHAEIMRREIRAGIREIVSLDAHHDCGYDTDDRPITDKIRSALGCSGMTAVDIRAKLRSDFTPTCGNWVRYLNEFHGIETSVIYPQWRLDHMEQPPVDSDYRGKLSFDSGDHLGVFNRVFICRSPEWAPTWLDTELESFIRRCPATRREYVPYRLRQREWDYASAERMARNSERLIRRKEKLAC